MKQFSHRPVLLAACLKAFESIALHRFVDGTLGAGGHSEAILQAHPECQQLIGIDQDKHALDLAKKRLAHFPSSKHFISGNFSQLQGYLQQLHVENVDGILVDLGVSSMQLDQPERGFSFMRDGPLDMRMNQDAFLTAAEIVNTWTEVELRDLFFRYGEEKESRKMAYAICVMRQKQLFSTTRELAELIEHKFRYLKRPIHPATKIFQALRIAVNQELDHLEKFLLQVLKVLRKGSRLAIITFHSLEDRIVKQTFAYWASDKESTSGLSGLFISKKPEVAILTRKPLEASEEEIQENPRSRSAKLRVIEKL